MNGLTTLCAPIAHPGVLRRASNHLILLPVPDVSVQLLQDWHHPSSMLRRVSAGSHCSYRLVLLKQARPGSSIAHCGSYPMQDAPVLHPHTHLQTAIGVGVGLARVCETGVCLACRLAGCAG